MNIRNVQNISALMLVLVASNSHANLIINGGFEDGLTSWTCTKSSAFVKCDTEAAFVPYLGELFFIGFEGEAFFDGYDNGSGSYISQGFATDIDETYSISFAYNAGGGSNVGLTLDVGDLSAEFYPSPIRWETYTADFVATSSFSTVEFEFQSSGSGSIWIDAVVVELKRLPDPAPVPAPATLALFGLGLAALGFSRRDRNKPA